MNNPRPILINHFVKKNLNEVNLFYFNDYELMQLVQKLNRGKSLNKIVEDELDEWYDNESKSEKKKLEKFTKELSSETYVFGESNNFYTLKILKHEEDGSIKLKGKFTGETNIIFKDHEISDISDSEISSTSESEISEEENLNSVFIYDLNSSKEITRIRFYTLSKENKFSKLANIVIREYLNEEPLDFITEELGKRIWTQFRPSKYSHGYPGFMIRGRNFDIGFSTNDGYRVLFFSYFSFTRKSNMKSIYMNEKIQEHRREIRETFTREEKCDISLSEDYILSLSTIELAPEGYNPDSNARIYVNKPKELLKKFLAFFFFETNKKADSEGLKKIFSEMHRIGGFALTNRFAENPNTFCLATLSSKSAQRTKIEYKNLETCEKLLEMIRRYTDAEWMFD